MLEPVPDAKNVFYVDLDSDLLIYQSGKELIGAIHMLMEDENLRNTIAQNGYNKVMTQHTFRHRCTDLFEELKQI